jgi:GNAT superfamily N-acetyltransferase
VEIRVYRPGDIEQLEQWQPTGLTRTHQQRARRQSDGDSSYLIVWESDTPVGTGEIRWNGCGSPEVLARFPDCPELNGLQVWPEGLRSLGIGTELIGAAEQLARQRGFDRIGLGVADDNDRAARLYLRLGYAETGCRYLDRYHYVAEDGTRHEVAEPCRFLVKQLTDDPAPL